MSSSRSPDRTRPPEPGPPRALTLPSPGRFTLSAGAPVWVLERHELPEVSVRVLMDAGAATERMAEAGVAELTARLLTEGAGDRSAQEMARWLDNLGARFRVAVSYDASMIAMHLLSEVLEDGLDFLRTAVREPVFEPEEVRRVRTELLDEIERDLDEPDAVADEALGAAIYGDHPYGRPSDGLYPTVSGLEAGDLSDFHHRRYEPGVAAIVVCGDVDPGRIREALAVRFGDWGPGRDAQGSGGFSSPPPTPRDPAAESGTVLVHRPGSAQSEIRIGGVGCRRDDPEYPAIQVANAILGGLFNSRINMNLREDKGWTYGARTAFRGRRGRGPFVARTAVETSVTADALREMEREITGLREDPPSDRELRLAKNALTLSLPRQFETVSQVSRRTAAQVVYDLPDDYWERYQERVEGVTAGDVTEVAERFLDPRRLVRVVVGDADALGERLGEREDLEIRPGP